MNFLKSLVISISLLLLALHIAESLKLSNPFDGLREKFTKSKCPKDLYYLHNINGHYEIRKQNGVGNENWLAKAYYNKDSINSTGWSFLEIETNSSGHDLDQAYFAGYTEGALTRELIDLQIVNTLSDFCTNKSDPLCRQLVDFLQKNLDWMQNQVTLYSFDPYWHQVQLTLFQLGGLIDGYENRSAVANRFSLDKLNLKDDTVLYFMLLQLSGDVGEILSSLQGTVNTFTDSRCSALIKVLDNNADLYVSHDTWSEYSTMIRVLKHYKFYFHISTQDKVLVPGNEMVFSSYPGTLLSIDDFYLTRASLAIIETTIGNSNPDLWKYVTPSTNLYWIRNLVANRISYTGVDWARTFAQYNSGTYNNEWMIVDYKLFTPGEPLQDNLLIVLEQLPGTITWADKTSTLRSTSYWASYNTPYFPDVYNMSGTYSNYLQYGNLFSYDNCSRANVFRREQANITDIDSMIHVMRFNNFKNDPFSICDQCTPKYSGELTIAGRSDLNPADGVYILPFLGHRQHGAIDMKLTNSSMIRNLEFIAIGGPSSEGNDVPAFAWSKSDFNVSHYGQPDLWNFPPVHVNWKI